MDHFFVHDIPGLPASSQVGSLRSSGLSMGAPSILEDIPIPLVPPRTARGDRVLVATPDVLGTTLEKVLVATHLLVSCGLTIEVLNPRLTLRPSMLPALTLLEHTLQRTRKERRRAGRSGGRPVTLDADILDRARQALSLPDATVPGVAKSLGVPPSTLYRQLGPRRQRK